MPIFWGKGHLSADHALFWHAALIEPLSFRSESSMFVYPHKLILKTCGTTTLLLALPRILEVAKQYCGFEKVWRVFYSRKAFMFPERQVGPHRSWESEVEFLNRYFGKLIIPIPAWTLLVPELPLWSNPDLFNYRQWLSLHDWQGCQRPLASLSYETGRRCVASSTTALSIELAYYERPGCWSGNFEQWAIDARVNRWSFPFWQPGPLPSRPDRGNPHDALEPQSHGEAFLSRPSGYRARYCRRQMGGPGYRNPPALPGCANRFVPFWAMRLFQQWSPGRSLLYYPRHTGASMLLRIFRNEYTRRADACRPRWRDSHWGIG